MKSLWQENFGPITDLKYPRTFGPKETLSVITVSGVSFALAQLKLLVPPRLGAFGKGAPDRAAATRSRRMALVPVAAISSPAQNSLSASTGQYQRSNSVAVIVMSTGGRVSVMPGRYCTRPLRQLPR
ncbi:hypothetical protein RA29_10205 [Tateyamaria sp. ANG-S1]|nr:hypothetical protein RA29_10205 [Tateyamaria sp. ANG-S1]